MSDIDISIKPANHHTWAAVPEDTVGALDLLALTLADLTGWRISVELCNGITLTAKPATTTDGDTE